VGEGGGNEGNEVEANQMTGLVEESQEDLQPRPHRSRRADMQATPR
jgi:hypothetical protein